MTRLMFIVIVSNCSAISWRPALMMKERLDCYHKQFKYNLLNCLSFDLLNSVYWLQYLILISPSMKGTLNKFQLGLCTLSNYLKTLGPEKLKLEHGSQKCAMDLEDTSLGLCQISRLSLDHCHSKCLLNLDTVSKTKQFDGKQEVISLACVHCLTISKHWAQRN
jgi:hypothetical protein